MNLTPLSDLTDEELLLKAYNEGQSCTDLELELAVRLEHALDELAKRRNADPEPEDDFGSDT